MDGLSRRALLRAVAVGAGSAALLPIMSRLVEAGPKKVTRFLFIVEGNCYEPVTVLDPLTLQQINAAGATPALVAPTVPGQSEPQATRWWYDAYRQDKPLIVPSTQFANTIALPAIASQGLASKTAVVFGLSSRITGGGHSTFQGALSSTRTVGNSPGGITIDAYLAGLSAVRQNTPYDAIRLGTVPNNPTTRLSYATCAYGAGRAAAAITDPVAAFGVYFGLVGTPAQMTAFTQQGSLLDYAKQDVAGALKAFNGSSSERAKLETYLGSVEQQIATQTRLRGMTSELSALHPVSPDQNTAPYPNGYPDLTTDCMQRFTAQLNLAMLAFKGQLANVAVLQSGTGGDFSSLVYPNAPLGGPLGDDLTSTMRHPMHHMSATTPAALQTIHDMTKFQFTAVAAAAADLMKTPDPAGSGSMLDNTVIVFIADNGEQHHSTASEFPVVLIGGSNTGLKTGGRTIVYPGVDTGGSGHRQVSNLWNTLGHLAGDDLNSFGGEGPLRFATGPLPELMS
jgi:Protein of unknown function (DUF1552)